jgi:hypothetical protein
MDDFWNGFQKEAEEKKPRKMSGVYNDATTVGALAGAATGAGVVLNEKRKALKNIEPQYRRMYPKKSKVEFAKHLERGVDNIHQYYNKRYVPMATTFGAVAGIGAGLAGAGLYHAYTKMKKGTDA